MDVKFNIFPTSDAFGSTVGELINTKDRGDINIIENKKMMILNGEKYKFDNHNKKQKWCGPGIYVDKIFMGKNAWVPSRVPVGYKCLIRKGQTMFWYETTIFSDDRAQDLQIWGDKKCTRPAGTLGKLARDEEGGQLILTDFKLCAKGSARWCIKRLYGASESTVSCKYQQKKSIIPKNNALYKIKLYRIISSITDLEPNLRGNTRPVLNSKDQFVFDRDLIFEKVADMDEENPLSLGYWRFREVERHLIVSRNGRLTYRDGRIDYKLPDSMINYICRSMCSDVVWLDSVEQLYSTNWRFRIQRRYHLNYIPQIKVKRTVSPVILKGRTRDRRRGKWQNLQIDWLNNDPRLIRTTRVGWKTLSTEHIDDTYTGVFSWIMPGGKFPYYFLHKRKFISTWYSDDIHRNITDIKKYIKLDHIDLRLIRRIGNEYVYDQNCRSIRIKFSSTSPGYPDYKRVTIDIK